MMPKTNQINMPTLPDNYEIFFSPTRRSWSIFYAEPGAVRADLMADGFTTKEDAIEYLLFP